MNRRLVLTAVAVCTGAAVLVGTAGAASAATAPIPLDLGQAQAFAILGYSCGGIQESVTTSGFDPSSGYPVGVVDMKTSCGGSGRGGGYHTTTYTASADVVWDFTGAVVSTSVPATGTVTGPGFVATDAAGNQVANSGTGAYLQLADGYVPVPRVTGISATVGPASGGTAVTITGTGFTGATGVAFGGVPASFTVTGDTSISAVAPTAAAGTVDVTVSSAGGTGVTGPSDRFTFVAAPTITSLSPSSGPLNGGNDVVVTGTGLAGVTSVAIGGNAAAVTAQSDSSLTVVAPAGDAVDTTELTATSIGGTASAAYTYTAPSVCGTGCAFVTPASVSAATGVPFAATVQATGGVLPTYGWTGKLPGGVTFVDNGDGTATLSGTPGPLGRRPAAGTWRGKVTATFAYGTVVKKVTQKVVLTVS